MSPILVNLVEDHGFISEEYYLHWHEVFWGSPKQSQLMLKVDNIIPMWRVVIPNTKFNSVVDSSSCRVSRTEDAEENIG